MHWMLWGRASRDKCALSLPMCIRRKRYVTRSRTPPGQKNTGWVWPFGCGSAPFPLRYTSTCRHVSPEETFLRSFWGIVYGRYDIMITWYLSFISRIGVDSDWAAEGTGTIDAWRRSGPEIVLKGHLCLKVWAIRKLSGLKPDWNTQPENILHKQATREKGNQVSYLYQDILKL